MQCPVKRVVGLLPEPVPVYGLQLVVLMQAVSCSMVQAADTAMVCQCKKDLANKPDGNQLVIIPVVGNRLAHGRRQPKGRPPQAIPTIVSVEL